MRRDGFTLIEVLTVVVIVGIMATMMAARWAPDDGATLRNEAARLAVTLERGVEEASATDAPTAIGFDKEGYRLYRWDEDEWRPDEQARWSHRSFPRGATTEATFLRLGPGTPPAATVTLAMDEATVSVRLSPVGIAEVVTP